MRGIISDHALLAPSTLDETLAVLAQGGGAVRPLAGGTDVMVELAAGVLKHERFVSIWQHDELRGITVNDDTIEIGALNTYSDIRGDATLSDEFPMLGQAAAESGAWAIQNRGTIGGNIVNASPAADTPPALLAYDASVRLLSTRGARVVPYASFHTGYKQMERAPDELVAAVLLPRRPFLSVGNGGSARHHYRKVGTRKAQAISKVCLAALGVVTDGLVSHVRVAYGSVAAVPLLCTTLRSSIEGTPADATLADRMVAGLGQGVAPIDDVRSTAVYRQRVAENLVRDFARELTEGVVGAGRP